MNASISTFLITSFVLAITPGPSIVYTVAYTLRYGLLAGVVSALGVNVGSYIAIFIAASGIGTMAVAYPEVLNGVRLVGAFYILYLAYKMWPNGKLGSFLQEAKLVKHSYSQLFKNGIITSLLNPKDIIFYLAFVSQFIKLKDNATGYTKQFLILSFTYAFIGLGTKLIFILFSGKLKSSLTGGGAIYMNYAASIMLCLVSLYIVFTFSF